MQEKMSYEGEHFFRKKHGYYPGEIFRTNKYPKGVKKCIGCQEEKKLDDFYYVGSTIQSRCKDCSKKQRNENNRKAKLKERVMTREPLLTCPCCNQKIKRDNILIQTDLDAFMKEWVKNRNPKVP